MGLQDILRKQVFYQMDINTFHNKDGGVFYPSQKCSGEMENGKSKV